MMTPAETSKPNGDVEQPSPWVLRFAEFVTPNGAVLDVACGNGRHARLFAARGHLVTAVDRDISRFRSPPVNVVLLEADLEANPWPLPAVQFAGVVVTHYLHRPLFADLLAAVAPGGLLIYETFTRGNEAFGRPTRPEFLLEPGELRERIGNDWTILDFDEGFTPTPRPAVMQRIAARRLQ